MRSPPLLLAARELAGLALGQVAGGHGGQRLLGPRQDLTRSQPRFSRPKATS
jgi:hypothetical protein